MRAMVALFFPLVCVLALTACRADGSEAALFVINAPSASVDESTLTLFDVPAVVYFADRPERDAGHITVARYVELWTPPADASDFSPPNAELSVLAEDGSSTSTVVVLESVRGDSAALIFSIQVLEGEMPRRGLVGPVALFIDACDPASPYCGPY